MNNYFSASILFCSKPCETFSLLQSPPSLMSVVAQSLPNVAIRTIVFTKVSCFCDMLQFVELALECMELKQMCEGQNRFHSSIPFL